MGSIESKYSNFRLLKFGALNCGPCIALAKARTLERVAEEFPGIGIKVMDCEDKNGEAPPGTEFEKASALAEEYEVSAFPTIILEARGVGEVWRVEEAVS